MRNSFFLTLLLSAFALTACSKGGTSPDQEPDLTVNFTATENGNTVSTISIDAPENQVNNQAASISYNSLANTFTMNVNGAVSSGKPMFNFTSMNVGGIQVGSIDVSGALSCTYLDENSTLYTATSGTIEITNREFNGSAQGIDTYYVDGTINITLTSTGGSTIQLTGSFEGIAAIAT